MRSGQERERSLLSGAQVALAPYRASNGTSEPRLHRGVNVMVESNSRSYHLTLMPTFRPNLYRGVSAVYLRRFLAVFVGEGFLYQSFSGLMDCWDLMKGWVEGKWNVLPVLCSWNEENNTWKYKSCTHVCFMYVKILHKELEISIYTLSFQANFFNLKLGK